MRRRAFKDRAVRSGGDEAARVRHQDHFFLAAAFLAGLAAGLAAFTTGLAAFTGLAAALTALAGLAAGALAALRAAALASTAALKVAPGVNLGSLAAAILILAPVLGFTPLRAARACSLKEPKPGMVRVSPFLTVATITSCKVSRTRPASALVSSCLVAKCWISSVLFM